MKHFSRGLWMVLGLCLGFLAACDDAPRSVVTFRLDDVWTFAQGAMVAGPLPVDIRGRPHGDDDLARNDAVIGAMTQAITWTANPRFTADGSASLRSSIRVVVTFNGTGGVGGGEQCRGVSTGEARSRTARSGSPPRSATARTCWRTSAVTSPEPAERTIPGSRA